MSSNVTETLMLAGLIIFWQVVPSWMRLRIFKMVVLAVTMVHTVLVLMLPYIVLRMAVLLVETAWLFLFRRDERRLRQHLSDARSYEEWCSYATELDKFTGRDVWKTRLAESEDEAATAVRVDHEYDWPYISGITQDLQAAREQEDVLLAIALVQQCCRRNVAGIMNPELYSHTYTGETKPVVTDFVDEIVTTMHWITHFALDLVKHPTAGIEKLQRTAATAAAAGIPALAEETTGDIVSSATSSLLDAHITTTTNTTTMRSSTLVEDIEHAFQNAQSMATLDLLGAIGGGTKRDQASMKHRRSSFAKSMTGMGSAAAAAAVMAATTIPPTNDENPKDATQPNADATTTTTAAATEAVLDVETLIQELLGLFQRARINYGRTAMCLSGGGNMALYHLGHVLGLLETGNLPHIFTGASGGSLVAAMVCTRTDDELKRELHPGFAQLHTCFERSWPERIQSLWKHGYMFDEKEFYNCFRLLCNGDWTFEEAYKRTGRVLCISLSSTKKKVPPMLLNHITTPNVVITSAVTASCAFPILIPKQKLQYKDADGYIRTFTGFSDQAYIDGSLQDDIPAQELAETLNCRFFIVGQCNPHIVPFFYRANGAVGLPSLWENMRSKGAKGSSSTESWRGGYIVSAIEAYLKVQMKSNFHFLAQLGERNHLAQDFHGSVTLVPDVHWRHYTMISDTISVSELDSMFQVGAVAAYRHSAMLANHYKLADALAECLARLESRHMSSGQLKLKLRPVIHLRKYEFVLPKPFPELNSELARKLHKKLVTEEAAAAAHSIIKSRSRSSSAQTPERRRRSSLFSSTMAEEDEYDRDWVQSLDKTITANSAGSSSSSANGRLVVPE